MIRWWQETLPRQFRELAENLAVPDWTLGKFGLSAAFAGPYGAWAFSMWDGLGHLIGIRLRYMDGKKLTVKDTHNGLFIPMMNPKATCLICEGPTDTAAAIGLGYFAIGRPSCSGGVPMIKDFFNRTRVRKAVIVADLDDPGLKGAKMLSHMLQINHCIITLPAKDLRAFVGNGGDRATVDCLIRSSLWNCPR